MNIRKRTVVLGGFAIFFLATIWLTFPSFHSVGTRSEFDLENINEFFRTDNEGIVAIVSGKQEVIRYTKTGKLEYTIKRNQKKGFNRADEIAVNKGDVYVLDTVQELDDSIYVQQQKILKYTNGQYVKTVFQYNYPKKHRNRFDGNFQSLAYENGQLTIVERKENGFILHKVDETSGKLTKLKEYSYKQANFLLRKFVYQNGEMFVLSKVGDIFRFSKGNWVPVYKASEHSQVIAGKKVDSLPWELVVRKDGVIYATDVGTRTLLKITPSDQAVQLLKQKGFANKPLHEQPLYYGVDLDEKNRIFLNGDNSLVRFEEKNQTVASLDHITVPLTKRLWSYLFLAAVVLLIGVGIVWIFPLLKHLLSMIFGSGTGSLELGMFIFVSITAFLVSNMVINNYNERYKQEVLHQMSSTATLVASVLDLENFKQLDAPDDYTTKAYKDIRRQILNVVENGNEWDEPLYIELYRMKDDVIYTCANTNQRGTAYYPWEWPWEGSPEQKIYQTKKGKTAVKMNSIEGAFLLSVEPILDENKRVIGLIEVGSSMDEYIRQNQKMIWKVVFGTMSLIIVMMLLIREALIFSELYNRWKEKRLASSERPLMNGNIVRPIVFMSFLASNLAAAFMPVYSESLYTPFLGISKETAAALPMTAEILFVAFGFVAGAWSEKLGIRKMLLISLVCFAVGQFGCYLAPNVWLLTVGSAVSGLGSGMCGVAAHVYIGSLPDEAERAKGFVSVNAAILSGINVGVIIGAILASFLGNHNVFFVASMLVLLLLGYVYYFIGKIPVREEASEHTGMNFFKFLFRPRIFFYFIGILVPYLACSYFLHYFFPIFGKQKGLSELEIGQAFLLNGVWVVFLGPVLAKFMLMKFGKVGSILVGVLLYALAFAIFGFRPTLFVALVVLVMLGIADSFTFTAQNVYFSDLDEVRRYGVNRSMGAYSLFENLGQAVGPMLFSTVIVMGERGGVLILCVVLVIMSLIFGGMNIRKKKKVSHSDQE